MSLSSCGDDPMLPPGVLIRAGGGHERLRRVLALAADGIVTHHKQAKALAFRPLRESMAAPGEFLFSDFSKLERPALLHLGFQALDAFQVAVRPLLPTSLPT